MTSDRQSPAARGDEGTGDSGKQQASSQGGHPSHPMKRPSPRRRSPTPPKPSKPKPSHTHSWNAVYRTGPVCGQQWVSKWVDAYKGRQERYICNQCGYVAMSGAQLDKHFMDSYLAGGNCGTYLDGSYDIWEKEDHGSYQTVQTGTKQVLDHYECSCGATK